VALAEPGDRIALISKAHPAARPLLEEIARCVERRGLVLAPDRYAASVLQRDDGLAREQVVEGASLVISVGGDGTLLACARAVGSRQIPILGVNLGRLGFLTETGHAEVGTVLEETLDGRSTLIRRQTLAVEKRDATEAAPQTALNDVTFSKKGLARLFQLSLFVDDEWVADYRADGLIVSTPTGSTAYNLAAGGPVVVPGVDALLVTPICPHSLSQRPILVPGASRIGVTLADGEKSVDVQMTVDGQVGLPLRPGERVEMHRADHQVLLVRPAARTFFSVLRDKLGWGQP
jgi:NAD+ kinase